MAGGTLSHIRVLDLTQRLAGPYGTQMLGDLGAEIIKLEPPGGDPTHNTPPHFVGGESTYYLSFNRNKRSIIIDLKAANCFANYWANATRWWKTTVPASWRAFLLITRHLKKIFPRWCIARYQVLARTGPTRSAARSIRSFRRYPGA